LADSRRHLELIATGRLAKPKQLSPPRGARTLDRLQLQRALEAIDIFPRCVLLLTIFERLPMEDAVTLLDAGKETISTAQAIALTELAGNLAREQGWRPETSVPQQPIFEAVCPAF
jgi:hypothetical protein